MSHMEYIQIKATSCGVYTQSAIVIPGKRCTQIIEKQGNMYANYHK